MEQRGRPRAEQGSATLAIAVVAGCLAIATAGLAVVGNDAILAARSQTVADGVALAAVVGGDDAAHRIARAGGGDIDLLERSGVEAAVVIRIGPVVAQASARRDVAPGGSGARAGLAPAMLAALARADELLGFPVPVISGRRSRADQQRLWDNRLDNAYVVARPGTSRHELGLAIDVPLGAVEALESVQFLTGICHPLPESDPVHFTVCRNRT